MQKICWLYFFLILANGAQAATLEDCAAAEVTNSHGVKYTFWQHEFKGGARDLVMSQYQPEQKPDIKRVTFDNAQGCTYQTLAVAEGAGWGWHLAWAGAHTLYYARMDGEAWVSSVPKKIATENVRELHFSQNAGLLILSWQTDGTSFSMQSDDEGRSWQSPLKIPKD